MPDMTQDKRRDELAKKLHQIYSDEVWRQHQQDPSREVRWQLPYEELPENIKELDRVLADFILARERLLLDKIGRPLSEFKANTIADYDKTYGCDPLEWGMCDGEKAIDSALAVIEKESVQ